MILTVIADPADISSERITLPPYSAEKISRRKTEAGKTETFLGEAVRFYLLRSVGAEHEETTLGEHGKPYLPSRPDIKYNISHSRNLAAGILLADDGGADVGCDIEHINKERDRDRISRIMRRSYTKAEIAAIEASDDPTTKFYLTWSRKESYIKYTGEGMSCPLLSVDTEGEFESVCIISYIIKDSFGEEYALSFCVPKERLSEVKAPVFIKTL